METDYSAQFGYEPSLAEMLNDPIVRLVMRRDQVSEEILIEVIESAQRSVRHRTLIALTRAA